jgi:hypothetical protein
MTEDASGSFVHDSGSKPAWLPLEPPHELDIFANTQVSGHIQSRSKKARHEHHDPALFARFYRHSLISSRNGLTRSGFQGLGYQREPDH